MVYKSTFSGLSTSLSGMLAAQIGLDTTANNISNSEVEGYSRQRADLVSSRPLSMPGFNQFNPGQLGQGVTVQQIIGLHDRIAERNLMSALGTGSATETMVGYLYQIETIMGEPGDGGIAAVLGRFFSALDDVAAAPDDLSVRQVFIDTANQLAARFNQVGTALAQVSNDIDQRLNQVAVDVNTITTQIAQLNRQIANARAGGQQPNWEVDERNRLMNQLGELINFTHSFSPTDDGVTITFNGINIVDPTVAGGTVPIARLDIDGAFAANTLVRGEAFALEDLFVNRIPALSTSMNDLVASLVGGLNGQHAAGFDLNGAGGGALFAAGGLTMTTMSVDAALAADPRLLALAGSWVAPGEPGNGDNANALLALRDLAQGAPINDTWESYYRTQIGSLGSNTQAAMRDANNARALVASMRERVDQASGVNIDEEMTNMLRFQNAYNAAARVLTSVDEMLDQLINRTGRVGL